MISIDQATEAKLSEVLGGQLDRITAESLIAEFYRIGKLSVGQAASLLSLSIDETCGFMKERGICVNYTMADFEADWANLRELRNAPR